MESTVFKKMKLKPGTTGFFLYAPEEYLNMIKNQDFIDVSGKEKYDFVHLFIESKKDYYDRINEALAKLSDTGALWISYPKADKNNKYDINRDIIFKMASDQGLIICSNVALDERWSALRFKRA